MAAADPRQLLAIEVHWPGIAALLRRLEAAGIDNVRVVEGDAVEVLRGLAGQVRWTRCGSSSPTPGPRRGTTSAG